MLLLINPKFFKNHPDWKSISQLKEKRVSKDYLDKMLNENYSGNSYGRAEDYSFNQSQKTLIERVLSNITADPQATYKQINKKLTFPTLIQIERDKVTLDIGSLIFDQNIIEYFIEMIFHISQAIERDPIPTENT